MVDRQGLPDERVDRPHGELGTAELHRRVDLLLAVAGHLRLQVTRNREVVETVVAGIRAEERHRISVLVGTPADSALPGRVVAAEEEDRRRAVEEEPAVRRERRSHALR